MKKEYILCAAVLRKERRKSDGNPYHEGTNDILNIELGYRHHDIFQRFPNELSLSPKAQGFYTSKGRFVDRREAFKIALDVNQLDDDRVKDFSELNVLCSEDLY